MSDRLPALPAVAAYAAGVRVKTLRKWVERGRISERVNGCYDLTEILAWVDGRDTHHAKIAHNRYTSV
jgi:hypothetical protein